MQYRIQNIVFRMKFESGLRCYENSKNQTNILRSSKPVCQKCTEVDSVSFSRTNGTLSPSTETKIDRIAEKLDLYSVYDPICAVSTCEQNQKAHILEPDKQYFTILSLLYSYLSLLIFCIALPLDNDIFTIWQTEFRLASLILFQYLSQSIR